MRTRSLPHASILLLLLPVGFSECELVSASFGGDGLGLVVAVRVAPDRAAVPVGGSLLLEATAAGEKGRPVDARFVWESSSPAVAGLSSRLGTRTTVIGRTPGDALIRVRAFPGGRTDAAVVTVTPCPRETCPGDSR